MAYTNDSIWKSVDWMTICIYLMLVIFGWFSVCGASYDYGEIDFFSFDTRAGNQFLTLYRNAAPRKEKSRYGTQTQRQIFKQFRCRA